MPKYGSNKELSKILEAIVAQGWRVQGGGGRHWKCYAPDGKKIVIVPCTTSLQYNRLANIKAEFRRAGADV